MRPPVALVALTAVSLLSGVHAQSAYGTPDGEPSSGDGSNGYPGGSDATTTASGDVPSGGSVQPTCPFGGPKTTTVFVTVSPSDAGSSAGGSDGQGPAVSTVGGVSSSNHGSDMTTTYWKDTRPTDDAVLSSIEASISQHPVKPFTTMTIDIWGTDSSSGGTAPGDSGGSNSGIGGTAPSGPSPYGSGLGSETTSGAANPNTSGSGDAGSGDGPGSSTNASAPTATGYDATPSDNNSPPSYTDGSDSDGSGHMPSGGSVSTITSYIQEAPTAVPGGAGYTPTGPQGYTSDQSPGTPTGNVQNPTGSSPWCTVVTDTDIQWTIGPSGPSQVTVLSPHTISAGGNSHGGDSGNGGDSNPDSSGNSGDKSSTCVTVIGADGKPTVIETGAPGGNGSPFPVPTSAALPGGISTSAVLGPAGGSGGSPSTTCVTVTVLGDDGLPTVVDSTVTLPIPQTPMWGSAGLPNLTPAAGNGAGVTTCATYTVIGGDGKPTVIESSFVVPTPSDAGAVTSSALANSVPAQITEAPSSQGGESGNGGNGGGLTTCITYTYLGPDGSPTVVESSVVLSAPTASNFGISTAQPTGVPAQVSSIPSLTTNGNGIPNGGAETTCTSYTYVGADGLPTVVETSWTVSGPLNTGGGIPDTLTPAQVTPFPGSPYNGGGGVGGGNPLTTCISYTYIGTDGKPTVTDSTYLIPGPAQTVAGISTPLAPFPNSLPSQFTGIPDGASNNNGGSTTCVSYTVTGADGAPTVVETTLTFGESSALPFSIGPIGTPGISPGFPTGLPWTSAIGSPGLPEGYSAGNGNDGGAVFTTATFIGPDGALTPVVESTGMGIPQLTSWPQHPTPGSDNNGGASNGQPGLPQYGGGNAITSSILPPSFQPLPPTSTADAMSASGMITDVQTSTFTILVTPGGTGLPSGAGLPPSYGDSMDGGLPAPNDSPYGQSSQMTLWPASAPYSQSSDQDAGQAAPAYGTPTAGGFTTRLQVSTWENIIPEPTTTYTMNFPLTTVETVPMPPMTLKRMARRQAGPLPWSNSSSTPTPLLGENTPLGASLSSALGVLTPTPTPFSSQPTPPAGSGSEVCASGGKIGNTTINFDDAKPGPLFNPSDDFWFSEGFLIAPPSAQSSQSYMASSGGQLVEFVPQALSNPFSQGSGDVAEIGVGPNAHNSCFRFNFYGASLGCEAAASEQFCEFEVSAYTYAEGSSSEQSIAWSETKRVPACTAFPSTSCTLTPVEFEGYNDITAVLITLRVGLDLRVWWGDDFRMGWTDNSCTAAVCRANPEVHRVKRNQVVSAIRRGVYHWTPEGLERFDDEVV